MSYENPEVPHEVNVSRESAIAEFLRLVLGLGLVVLLATAVLYFFGGQLARLVPFPVERNWTGESVLGIDVDAPLSTKAGEIERYLQELVDGLAAGMSLPPGMGITVHYADMDVPNAFATLGGHVVVTSALYSRMSSENSLGMVLGHEIAHVKARDPIAAVGGGASVALVLALVSGEAEGLVPYVSQLVLLGYSRQAERRADDEAIAALNVRYGHAGGGAALFEVLAGYKEEDGMPVPSMLSTHPADAERIARVMAAASGWNPSLLPLVPIRVASE